MTTSPNSIPIIPSPVKKKSGKIIIDLPRDFDNRYTTVRINMNENKKLKLTWFAILSNNP
jgi:hypothetical protein